MRKRAAALVLCLLLMLQITAPSVRAEQSVYFVAVGSNVLPLTDATMPFWSGGYLYISSSIFTGVVWSAVGISHVPANARQPLILYSGEDRSLIFNLDKPYAEDPQGNTYYPGAVVRNGNVFVPASVVASYFGLQYSLIPNVEHGYLVWLRQPGYGLSDEEFATAATYPMASSYAQYLKSKESAQQTTPTPSVPEQDEEETPAVNGKNVYLCLKAGENTAQLLDVLDSAGEKASFFCSLEFLWTQGDLLRRTEIPNDTSKRLTFDKLVIDLDSYELIVDGKKVDTPPKELELLYHLASTPNRVYTRNQLLDEVWGFDYFGDSRTVDVHIKRLREKVENVSDQWALKTVWGVGYKFELTGARPAEKREG